MRSNRTATLLTLLQAQLLLISLCSASKYTAATDYGFGPLFIGLDMEGDKLTRCDNLNIALGGGFGPYRLGTLAFQLSGTPRTDLSSNALVCLVLQYR